MKRINMLCENNNSDKSVKTLAYTNVSNLLEVLIEKNMTEGFDFRNYLYRIFIIVFFIIITIIIITCTYSIYTAYTKGKRGLTYQMERFNLSSTSNGYRSTTLTRRSFGV